jgi:hypothetical protein
LLLYLFPKLFFLFNSPLIHQYEHSAVPAALFNAFKSLIAANVFANCSTLASAFAERAARLFGAVFCCPVLHVPQHLHIRPSSMRISAGKAARKLRSYEMLLNSLSMNNWNYEVIVYQKIFKKRFFL